MKLFNYIFLGLFLLFAALQYNDPDPYLWIPIYLSAAVCCYFAANGRYFRRAYSFGIAGYVIYALFLFVNKDGVMDWMNLHHSESLIHTMKAEKPWIEETREFGGLLILILVMTVNYVSAIKKGL
jgi:hypothetical protein